MCCVLALPRSVESGGAKNSDFLEEISWKKVKCVRIHFCYIFAIIIIAFTLLVVVNMVSSHSV